MNDNKFMELALVQAKIAKKYGDIPVGAVIVDEKGNIISYAYNKKHKKQNAIYHAEILAIKKACTKLKNFRLDNCTIYVTFEPCIMCLGAILNARLSRLVFGAYDKRFGSIKLMNDITFNHTCDVIGGVKEDECGALLSDFFSTIRKSNTN